MTKSTSSPLSQLALSTVVISKAVICINKTIGASTSGGSLTSGSKASNDENKVVEQDEIQDNVNNKVTTSTSTTSLSLRPRTDSLLSTTSSISITPEHMSLGQILPSNMERSITSASTMSSSSSYDPNKDIAFLSRASPLSNSLSSSVVLLTHSTSNLLLLCGQGCKGGEGGCAVGCACLGVAFNGGGAGEKRCCGSAGRKKGGREEDDEDDEGVIIVKRPANGSDDGKDEEDGTEPFPDFYTCA